ncbi:hypothetical protein [Salinibacterium sp. ZJ454]|uniref:hypothetical protein n=1 Tax=Salinibacterium sp. ZJ454 TaxID=2708339 RepID=UPI00141F5CC4|nr:hypothetical protein [Salinibacterium sp. ZJ454]
MTHHRREITGRNGASRRAARWLGVGAVGVILAATLSVGAAGAAVPPAAATDTDVEGNVTVDVIDDSPQPTPSPTRTNGPPFTPPGPPPSRPPVTPAGKGNTPPPVQAPVTAQVTQATIPDPAAADEALGDEAITTGGPLGMSGLSASATPSFEPGNGTLTLSFVVRNTSTSTFDSTARFWVNNISGGRLADIQDVHVDNLEPDETRRVVVRIDGLGQHVVLRTYVTLTPPQTVDGMSLSVLTRDTTAVVLPLFAISLVSGVGALSGLAWWMFSSRGLGLRFRQRGTPEYAGL